MIGYASNTGTKRNLEALRAHGWRILLTPDNPTPREGLRHGVDNGAWKAFQKQQPFDEKAFAGLVERHGASADFVVVPDIVAGGMKSLDFSMGWLSRLCHLKLLLLPVQDGMDVTTVSKVLRDETNLGIFLGGSTEWKLKTMFQWGGVAAGLDRYYHVGRVNTRRRIRLCAEAGADSFDGTSATMYSQNLPMLDDARRQPSLLTPRATP
jgi:hypothetical protein